MGDRPDEIEISLGVAEAGGRVVNECVNDPTFMAAPYWAGELAARVYRAMCAEASREERSGD